MRKHDTRAHPDRTFPNTTTSNQPMSIDDDLRRALAGALFLLPTTLLAATPTGGGMTLRTENYPRPPYSGATYYIYEQNGEAICTKLEVCNKYDNCTTEYHKGVYKDDEDKQTGNPYGTTPAVPLPPAKQKKHTCLAKFGLVQK